MGTGSSIVKTPAVEKIITITLQTPNVLALMDVDGPNGTTYQLINKEWGPGIESINEIHYVHVFNLNERPFASPLLSISKNHVISGARARQAFCHLLGRLDDLGIILRTSMYTGKMFCRTTLFFERAPMLTLDPDQHKSILTASDDKFICVSMRNKNVLQFPMIAAMGRIRLEWLRTEFGSHLASEENFGEYIEFTFKGQPFGNSGSRFEEMVMSKRLMLSLIRHFAANGFEYSAALSIRGGYKNDTFFFKSTKRSPETNTNFFLVCPEAKDRLRIFEAPVEASELIQSSIPSGQIKEIKHSYMGCLEIVMQGNPYDASGADLVETQLQFLELIDRLWSIGYELRGAIQTSLGQYDRNTLIFETSKEALRPLFGICLARSDTIKLLKVNSNVKTLVREVIIGLWPKGIQLESDINCGYAIKLKGRPFASRDTGADSHEGLHLITCIVEKLRQIGWQLNCAIDVGAKLVNEEETHAWSQDGSLMLFVREKPPNLADSE